MLSLFWLCEQGVHPNIKGEVWEFLLGCYDPKSTTEQRNQLRQQRMFCFISLFICILLSSSHLSPFSSHYSFTFHYDA
uniref:Rab-GAP TBC domain-containing protein n=1 Tax=Aegilops tauschii subsp. strangulata TaxID=200361 RepID=A0A453R9D5_AEGTS